MLELQGGAVRAFEVGAGPPVLVLPPGLDDGSGWQAVARLLAPHHRVLTLNRRRYRLDLPSGGTLAEEVEDTLALAGVAGPCLLVGHSSGAVLALEALLAAPERFVGAVLYEPPVTLPDRRWTAPLQAAQAALAQGRTMRAMQIFLRDIIAVPGWLAWVAALFVVLHPRYRPLVPRQIEDAAAVEALGVRFDAWHAISHPVVLLGGSKSPDHLRERLDALAQTLPHTQRVTLDGQGHKANIEAPARLAAVIEESFAVAGAAG